MIVLLTNNIRTIKSVIEIRYC